MIESWPAKLCGCEPPPGYAEHHPALQWVNGHLRYVGDGNLGAIQLERAVKLKGLMRDLTLEPLGANSKSSEDVMGHPSPIRNTP